MEKLVEEIQYFMQLAEAMYIFPLSLIYSIRDVTFRSLERLNSSTSVNKMKKKKLSPAETEFKNTRASR